MDIVEWVSQECMLGGDSTLPVSTPNFTVDPATNRIVGYCYDLAGNLLDDASCPNGSHKYAYDGANRLTAINTTAAVYSYFGPQRIKKVLGSTTTRYIYSGSKPIAEYVNGANANSPSTEYIYAGSQLLVTIAGSTTTYHHPDHLSNRAETNSSGTRTRTFGQLPFGETWYETGTPDKWKFTSYERDSGTGETGLDYANFRYYASAQGRFMSADLLAGHLHAPQSLNRYSYTINDPINLIDPLGLVAEWECGFDGEESWCIITPPNVDNDRRCNNGTEIGCINGGEGGGGGGDGSASLCDLVIRINNAANIPADQLSRIQDQIAKLFKPASVGVHFVQGGTGNVDADLSFESGDFERQLLDNWYGITEKKGRNGHSTVFSGTIQAAFKSRSKETQDKIEGTVGAHELIHQLLQWGHDAWDSKNPTDIMATPSDNPHVAADLIHDALKLTEKERQRLLEDCLSRKKKRRYPSPRRRNAKWFPSSGHGDEPDISRSEYPGLCLKPSTHTAGNPHFGPGQRDAPLSRAGRPG